MRLLVHAKHQGTMGRVEVQAHNYSDLDEPHIFGGH